MAQFVSFNSIWGLRKHVSNKNTSLFIMCVDNVHGHVVTALAIKKLKAFRLVG